VTSNLGRWSRWNAGYDSPAPYGASETYEMGADFLKPCATVEDWGCGRSWFRTLRPDVIGIDGSPSRNTDVVADLTRYTSYVEGIFMRHVLEHNYEWARILDNAVTSFTKRLVLVLFTPMTDEMIREIAFNDELGVPDLSFAVRDIEQHFNPIVHKWAHDTIATPTQYGTETIFLVEKR
jgi:hypothetical protein